MNYRILCFYIDLHCRQLSYECQTVPVSVLSYDCIVTVRPCVSYVSVNVRLWMQEPAHLDIIDNWQYQIDFLTRYLVLLQISVCVCVFKLDPLQTLPHSHYETNPKEKQPN